MTANFYKSKASKKVTASRDAPGVLIAPADAVPATSTADTLYKLRDRVFILSRPRLIVAEAPFGSRPVARLWLHECAGGGCFRVLIEHDALTGLPSVSACGVSDLDAAFDLLTARKRAPRGTRLHKLQHDMRRGTL